MELTIGLNQVVYIIGIANSIFLGLILLRSTSGNALANRLLAVLFVVWAYGFFYTFYITSGMYRAYPHIIMVGAGITFLNGPLLYLYIRTMVRPGFVFTVKHLLHFLPFLINSVYLVPFYFKNAEYKMAYLEYLHDYSSLFFLIVYAQLLHLAIYLALGVIEIHQHWKRIRERFSSIEKITLTWLRNLLIGVLFALVSYVSILVYYSIATIDPIYINKFSDILIVVIIHYIGYSAVVQPQIYTSGSHDTGSVKKYEKSFLDEKAINEIAGQLEKLMKDDKPYLGSELTLAKLASMLSVSPNHLSQVINRQYRMNFYDYVNSYRVEEAKKILQEDISGNKKILEIAYDAGFKSKSTFNTIFREVTATTPTQFRRTINSAL